MAFRIGTGVEARGIGGAGNVGRGSLIPITAATSPALAIDTGRIQGALEDIAAERAQKEREKLAEQKKHEELQRRIAETSWHARSFAEFSQRMNDQVEAFDAEGGAVKPDYAARVRETGETMLQEYLQEQSISPLARAEFEASALRAVTGFHNQALGRSRSAQAAETVDRWNDFTRGIANRANREPGGLDAALEQLNAEFDSFSQAMPAEDREEYRRVSNALVVRQEVDGMITKGRLSQAEALLNSGRFDSLLDPDTVSRLRSGIETERRRIVAENRDEVEMLGRSAMARAQRGEPVDDGVFDRIEALGGDGNIWAERVVRSETVFGHVSLASEMGSDERAAYLRAIRPDAASAGYQGRDTYGDDIADWDAVVRGVQEFETRLERDPAAAVDAAVARRMERDGASQDGEDPQARRLAYRIEEQRRRGVIDPAPMTREEARDWTGRFEQADVNGRIGMLGDLSGGMGEHFPRAIGMLADEGLPKGAAMAGWASHQGRLADARAILSGATHPEAAKILPGSTDFKAALQNRVAAIFPQDQDMYAATVDAARAAYVSLSQAAGATDGEFVGEEAEGRLNRAIEMATGGVIDYQGAAFLPPKPGVTPSAFERTLTTLADEDLAGARNATGSAVTAEDVLEGRVRLETLADGRYVLMAPDGAILDGRRVERGDPYPVFVLDLGDLWPRLGGRLIERAREREQQIRQSIRDAGPVPREDGMVP